MIHTLRGTAAPRRRIAVIQIPRAQKARLGLIHDGSVPRDTVIAWTTISDQEPGSSENWLAYVLQQQAAVRQSTPGTLMYSPGAAAALQLPRATAPWNSWQTASCDPSTQPPTDAAPGTAGRMGDALSVPVVITAGTPGHPLLVLAGLIGIGALVYRATKGRNGQ